MVAGKGAGGRPPLPVWVLTSPPAAGYAQNPISVYYVWDGSEEAREGGGSSAPPPAPLPPTPPARALAVVTNTPWGARVHFAFDPRGDKVTKCLHVSPFMDMEATWCVFSGRGGESKRRRHAQRERPRTILLHPLTPLAPPLSLSLSLSLSPPCFLLRLLSATPPGHRLHVAVGVDHPVLGRCFDASLDAACDGVGGEGEAGAGGRPAPPSSKKSAPTTPSASARSERGSLATLLAYGYMPHRTAAWIYWQGARLWLQRGLRVWQPPARGEDEARIKRKGVERREGGGPADTQPVTLGGHGHAWTPARVWPWSVQQ